MRVRRLLLSLFLPGFLVGAAQAQITAGNCVRFNGTNGYISVPHDAALNAYPLTITAWVRTSRNVPLYEAILNKYAPGAGNGYSFHTYNGRLRGFYFGPAGYVYPADPGFDGGFVADGQWHQVAMVIGPSGGAIYIDGVSRGTPQGWTGAISTTTSNAPITIGRYATNAFSTSSFSGDIDEVTIWNRALALSELNYLKHRRLNGSEDGLLSLWRLNEGSGTTSADATAAGRTATLNGPVAWKSSAAPIALTMVATNCLRFDGVNGYVSVPHNTNLNAYPFTAMGWFRTTNTVSPLVQGIVNKYQDSSGNGWALIVQNNKLRGFYYRTLGNYGMDVFSPGNVTDGAWHHAAMVVDASGGKLFLDGTLVASNGWFGAAGPPTGVEPLQIGHYYNYAERFFGGLDDISVWNRGLTGTEIQSMKNLPLTGNETNLLAYWRMDEGSGTTVTNVTGQGYNGAFIGPVAWTGSTAYLGDGSVHVRASTDMPAIQRFFALTGGAAGASAFPLFTFGSLWRFYDYGTAPANVSVSTRFTGDLQIAGSGTPLSVVPNAVLSSFNLAGYNASSPPGVGAAGGFVALNSALQVQPDAQIDSVNNLHQLAVTLSHAENGGGFVTDGTEVTAPARLLHFNGHVFFGPIETIVTNIVNTPTNSTITAPTHLATTMQIASGAASLAIAPSFKFGGGGAFNVNLGANGYATNLNGVFSLANPTQFFETNGIRYRLPGATLSTAGMLATNLEAWFPAGLGMSVTTNSRVLKPFVVKTNVTLGPDLLPTISPIVFTAASYGTNQLWFAEETKPVWFSASQIEWRIPEGEFYIGATPAAQFVRQKEDDDLAAQRLNLVDQIAADRVSNDEYYHSVVSAGGPVRIVPDTNGSARITMDLILQANEYRPHFPYMNRNVGGVIPVSGGALSIVSDLIDPASYLFVSGPVPVPYARDCSPEGGCSTFATVGARVLSMNLPAGALGTPHFNFTPDGGLLGYGSLTAPENLTWGFIGGGNYAQRTSDVQDGAVSIAGTFLRGDQSPLSDAVRPAVLLLTGWGDQANPAYFERPGTTPYADGFANYPGFNFRAPAQGRSFIAAQDTGLYPLTARSKYYTRFGGVSGIHESATFPANLTLYGYPFTFTSYRVSFLASENWESRTDGSVALGGPAGFNVEFERMKFLCRGNLDAARLPATIAKKHMLYWNADIQPLALQFKPKASDPCSLTERFLVLGVETKLPFIPQAFHASLGFKPNGNLVTKATAVEGVDSRFPVPANLQVQGPGGSYYPLTTVGDGYFNNWETPGRPDAGFYSLAGRLRVPFFRDIKVHAHVTPTGPTTSQLNLMGGWPAESGLGADRGWNVGSQNYFNTAKFDANADGWPTGASLQNYRNSPDETYRPRAQQNWIDVAGFDYPLVWNAVLRSFNGFQDSKVTLPVIDVDSRLKEISPGKVDFDFAQDLNVQLPRIKVLDLANDALNEINAPINTLSNAIRSELGAALASTGITGGFRSLQTVLRENADNLFRPVLQPALDPVVDNLYGALASALASGKSNLLYVTYGAVTAGSNGLQSAVQNLNGAAGNANSVLGKMNQTLTDVDDTLNLFLRVLEKDGGGNRHVIRAIIQKLAQDQGPALGIVSSLGDQLVNDLLADVEPTMAKVESELRQLRVQFNDVRTQVATASGDFKSALDSANHDTAALQNYLQQAGAGVSNLLSSLVGPTGDFFSADPGRAKQELRERLIVTFLSSAVDARYQQTFRQFLSDKNFLLDQLMDVMFDQINRSIRNGLQNQIAGARDGLFQNLKGAGILSDSLLSAKIRGAPTFEGDSLRKIHLDADVKMNLPDEMTFNAYMDIKELNSATTPLACIPPGAPAAEVTIGCKDVPLDWAGVPSMDGQKLRLSIEARWTLQSGSVKGVGGSLEINGKAGFKGCSMNGIKVALAIGSIENYFAGQAKATVVVLGVPVNFHAGIFAGHACSLDALKLVDPEAEKVVLQPGEFSGLYLEYGGGVSLSDILFGESSDLLDVRADITTAMFYQGGPRLGRIGGRQKTKVEAKLLYVIEGSASWAVFMVLDSAGKLTIGGEAELCAEIGVCPVCEDFCATLRITGVLTDGGIDYSIDY